MRLFLSIPVPKKLWPYLEGLQKQFPDLKPAKNFHMTLQFLGNDIDEEYLPEVLREVRKIKNEKFLIELMQPTPFGPPRDLKGVWIECKEDRQLTYLVNKIRDAMEICGFHEEKPFRPHITLGRYKKSPAKVPADVKWEPKKFQARHFELIRSNITAEGSTYEILQKKFFL